MKRLDDLVRSERHFTSGLLLHLLLHDDLRGVDALLDLLVARGVLAARPVADAARDPRTQVIAEFAVRRDLVAMAGVVDDTIPGDVIDVVLVAGDTLVAIEAKFFTRPTVREVRDQLAAQRSALGAVLRDPVWGVSRVVQVFLEHGRRLAPDALGCDGVLTWDEVHGLACELLGAQSYVAGQIARACARCEAELTPGAPGDVVWAGELDFQATVELCLREGDAVCVGFAGGERDLAQADVARLRARRWKWDHTEGPHGARRVRANWIPGVRFVAIVRALGALGPR